MYITFRAVRARLFEGLFLIGCLVGSVPTMAYDLDVHYYVTAMILADLDRTGSPMVEKKVLAAMSNQYVDDNPNTLPSLNPFKAQQRRNWHFPASMDTRPIVNAYGVTRRNSAFAKHNVNKGLEANDPYTLGIALHTYMDSFAHEGFEAYFGHAAAGHDPDRVHLDVNKFRESIWMTYSIIQQWYENNGIEVNATPLDLERYMAWATFVPPAYACLFCSYNEEIEQRSEYWFSLVNQEFPEISLPAYAVTEQCAIDKFEAAARNHQTPVREADAWAIQWYAADFENLFEAAGARALTRVEANESCEDPSDPSDPFYRLNRRQAAALALDDPDTLYNGLPRVLNDNAGISALFVAADQKRRDNGWETLFLSASAAHNKGVNWARFKKQLRRNLAADKLEQRLFAAGVLSIINDTDPATCRQINRIYSFYSRTNTRRLTSRQIAFLTSTIYPSPTYIAQCTTQSLPLLTALLQDDRVAEMAAARLYLISAETDIRPSGGAAAASRAAGPGSAAANIRTQSRDALTTRGAAVEGRVAATAAEASRNTALEYWSARALQDFDDDLQGTNEDQLHLAELERRLRNALRGADLGLASGIASAIGTFTRADYPPDSLIALLKKSVANPDYAPISAELRYALYQLAANQ